MHEHDALVFLLALAVLLGGARLLGELGRALGLPLVVGEIAAGVVLGETGLGRLAPALHAWLFPREGPARWMLSGYATLAIVLLLVVAGLEVDLRVAWRRGRSALSVAAFGMIAPLALGLGLGAVLPDALLTDPSRRLPFALFLGVALSISALPVIAKTLLDLGLARTELGLLVMTAAMLNDLVGWAAFSVLLEPMSGGRFDGGGLAVTLSLAAVFAAFCLTAGRALADRALRRLEAHPDSAPGRILSFVIVVAVLGAAATQAIGIHAVLGGFVVGVAIGGAPRLRERTRLTIQQFVTNVFAPVFFASVALRVDFAAAFDLGLVVVVFAVASVAKVAGGALGARLSTMGWRESLAVGFGLNARGVMEIILALVARQAGLLDDRVFVALVTMAVATSLVAGPAMKALLLPARRGEPTEDAAALVRAGAFVPRLAAATPARAIEELGRALRPALGDLVEPAVIAALERELLAPTGLGDDVAMPHAALEGLARPAVALGLAPEGIDFDAPDGRPARIVFFVLVPKGAVNAEIRALSALAHAVVDEPARAALLRAQTLEDAVRSLRAHARPANAPAPPAAAVPTPPRPTR